MSDHSVEPFIDNLWYYDSVVSPKSPKPLPPSFSDNLPLSSGGHSSPPPSLIPSSSSPPSLAFDPIDSDNPQTQDLHRVFDAIDQNHDGKLSSSELCSWMTKLGLDFTEEGMVRMVSKADMDLNGSLNFNEFALLNEAIDKEGRDDEAKEEGDGKDEDKSQGRLLRAVMLREAFELFDRDHNGLISPEELSITLENLGLVKKVNNQSQYVDMIKHVDMDGDGQVNFSEFQKMMDSRSIDFHPDDAPK